MTQAERARRFADLHVPGDPVVLYNIWDAGSAQAVAGAGARALATGSWSVAAAQGYPDGEAIPLDFLLRIVGRIAETSDLPLSVDFEAGYGAAPDEVAPNVARVIAAGAVGVNIEDKLAGGGVRPVAEQAARLAAIRGAAEAAGVPAFFLNARTDLFLQEKDPARHEALIAEALDRAAAYAEAGASGFFVPGLTAPGLIGGVCEAVRLPVNAMRIGSAPERAELTALGVARISYGPGPYRVAMEDIAARCRAI